MAKAMRWGSFLVASTFGILGAALVAAGVTPDVTQDITADASVRPATTNYLQFSGDGDYVEIPSAPDLSVGPEGFTVSAWLKPDTLEFPRSEGSGYVYWMGKGDKGRYEWAMRMYSYTNREQPPRPNRISFYLFNAQGGLGQGSYAEAPVTAGEWMQITATANGGVTAIYRDGRYVRCDEYDGPTGGGCEAHPERIQPAAGDAPLRLGARDLKSYFQGGLSQVRIWNRALGNDEVLRVFHGDIPQSGLVAEFLLDEGQGDNLHDSTGKHQGMISGARWAALAEKPARLGLQR